ncbi:hypothetical protein D3C81_2034940 [compost metagenome]
MKVNEYLVKALDGYAGNCVIAFYEVLYPLYSNKSVNITNLLEEKVRIIEKYKSQNEYLHLDQIVKQQASLRAMHMRLKKIKYAEAFWVGHFASYKHIVSSLLRI